MAVAGMIVNMKFIVYEIPLREFLDRVEFISKNLPKKKAEKYIKEKLSWYIGKYHAIEIAPKGWNCRHSIVPLDI